MNQLPIILKKARQALDLTQEDVAKRLGISQRAYAFYEDETNERIPKPKRLAQLGEVLNIPINSLMKHYSNGVEDKTAEEEEEHSPLPGTVTLQDHIAVLKANHENAKQELLKAQQEKDRLLTIIEKNLTLLAEVIKEGRIEARQIAANLNQGQHQLTEKLVQVEDNIVQRLGGLYQSLKGGEAQEAPGSVKKRSVSSGGRGSNDGKSKDQKA